MEKELSSILDVGIGDKIILMSPFGVETIVGALPKQESYIIDSIFDSGLIEFDQNVVFMNIIDLENLFNLDIDDRNMEIYLNKPNRVDETLFDIREKFLKTTLSIPGQI